MTSTLFIYATVPAPDCPTCPYLVVYENGDWNIEFGGDIDYIENTLFTSGSCVSLLQMFVEDEFDQHSEGVDLYLELEIESDIEEPVILIWGDGRVTPGDRFQAEKLLRSDNPDFFNYILLSELLDDLTKFITRHGDTLFDDSYGDDDFQPLNFDDED